MANQNFKVKKGLEVGTALTATSDGLNVTGIITATQFSGDGSGLTGVTAAGSGVVVQEEGSSVGTAATINFIGSNVTAAISGGVASVTITGGSSDVVSDTTPQLGGNLDLNSKDITGTGNISITGGLNATGVSTFQESVTFQSHASFGDNDKANFGAGNDIQIYHNGTNSFIDNTTGSLYIRGANGNHVRIQSRSGEESIVAAANGSVDLYYDNAKKLETTNTGITVTGAVSATGSSGYGLVFDDSVKISLGSNNDLRIYHNGANSLIDNDTGTLLLRSNEVGKDILLQSDDGSGGVADYIRCDGSLGEVRLYYYGNEKLNTKSDGIDVTGEVQCDSLDVDGVVNIDGSKVTYDSSNGLKLADSTQLRLGTGNDLRLYHSGTHSFIQDAGTGNLVLQSNRIDLQNAAGSEEMARFQEDGAVSLSFNGSTKFQTTNTGVTVTGTVAATAVTGDGSGLTSLTGASAGTYGASNITPVITVDSNGRITGISTVDTAGGGGGGGGISNISEDTTPQLGGDLDMNGNDIISNVNIVSTDSGNAAAPELSLYRNSSSPAAADYIGQIKFQGESSSGATRLYAKITGKIGDPTNGSEDGIIEIAHRKNGSNNISARWNQDELQLINGTELSLGDDQKIKIGASDDLQIYHDGTNSYVSDAGTGGLKITGSDVYIRNTSDQDMIHASSGSFVKLYHSNALRLQTTDTGVNITDNLNVAGVSTFQGNVQLLDNDKLLIGGSLGSHDGLEIYHTGSHSLIDESGTGNLVIRSNLISFEKYTNEQLARFTADGSCEFYYDNSKKFETTSSGATVTGTLTATAFSGDGSALTNLPASGITTSHTNVQVTYNFAASGNNYVITGPGYSNSDNNPDLYLVRGQRYRFVNSVGGSHPLRIQSDTSGTAYTDGVSGSQSGTQEFNVQHDAPSRLFYQCTIHSGMIGNIYITGGGQWENTSVAASGTPEIYTDYNVGIGTDNPNALLHLYKDAAGNLPLIQTTSNVANAGSFTNNYSVEFRHATSTVTHGMLVVNNEANDARRTLDVADSNGIFATFTNGKLGIGTVTPGNDLEIASSGNTKGLVVSKNGVNSTFLGHNGTGNEGLLILRENGTNKVQLYAESGQPSFINSGNLGIGTANPGHLIDLYNSAGSDCLRLNVNGSAGGSNKQNAIRFSVDGDVKAHVGLAVDAGRLIGGSIANDFCLKGLGSNNILFATNSAERLRITSDGRLLVGGSTSARSTFFNSSSWTPQVQIENNTDQKSSLSLICSHATNNQAGLLALGATKSSSLGGNGLTGSSQGLGIITFQGNDGSQMVEAARIQCVAAGTPSADNMPGELRFSVNSGSSGASERLRIDSSGRVKIGSISDHSAGETQAPVYIAMQTDITAIGDDEGTATAGLVRIEETGSNNNRYHGIELRNTNSGDIRILNQDVGVSNRGDLIIAMPDGEADSGVHNKIRFNSNESSIQISGKGGAVAANTGTEHTDIYIATKTGVTAINTALGTEIAGIIRFEDKGSNSNRYHGIELRNRNSGDIRILNLDEGTTNKANLVFGIDNGTTVAEAMRITSGGSVGFNTTLTQSSKTVHIAGDYRSATQNVADEGLIFQSFTTASTGNVYPGISWTGNPGALGRARAAITAIATNNNNGSDLVFLTRNQADGTELDVTDDEQVRITSAGNLLVGTTATNPGDGNTTTGTAFSSNGKYFFSCASDGGHINRNNAGYVLHTRYQGNHRGGIYVFPQATQYNTSSDYRLKENVVDISGAITRIKELAPRRFNFIGEPDTTVDGFLAHEAATVVPQAVTGTKDEVDSNGDPVYQGIDNSKFVPLLTAALQEAIAKIETLEARITALES